MDMLDSSIGEKSIYKPMKSDNLKNMKENHTAYVKNSNNQDKESCNYGKQVKVLEEFIFNSEKLGIDGLLKQFRKLNTFADPSFSHEAYTINMYKNRYSNIYCRDSTRVKLSIDATRQGDYIHANYVKTSPLHDTIICTQGPPDYTANDFWRMVFQERATSILMLCRVIGESRSKNVGYLPKVGEKLKYGCIKVTNNGGRMDDENNFELTNLKVEFVENGVPENEQPVDKSKLIVNHIRWPDWPDQGVPEANFNTVPHKLLASVRRGPCVVHCSAGVGRTGCMVALELAHRKLAEGINIDFEKIVAELREQRAQCIETSIQYLYIHCVMVAFARGNRGISKNAESSADEFLKNYNNHARRYE